MAISIKNEQTGRLARELARRTGETITTAVTKALREKLERLGRVEKGPLAERLVEIGKDCANRLSLKAQSQDHGSMLYDDRGLPK